MIYCTLKGAHLAVKDKGEDDGIDYTKLAASLLELEKVTKLANKLGQLMENTAGDTKFQQSVRELSANLEIAERLSHEATYTKKRGKTFEGETLSIEGINTYVGKVGIATLALIADMKDVRNHHKK